jgi:Ice-binding-like/IPTL-CTERM motif
VLNLEQPISGSKRTLRQFDDEDKVRIRMMRTHFIRLVAGMAFAVLLCGASTASAQAVSPHVETTSLGTYGVVSSTFTNANTPPQTIINGTALQPAVCGATLNAPAPLLVVGTTVSPCPAATGIDQGAALTTLNTQACTSLGAIVALESAPGHPTGIYTPGCYSSTGAMSVGTTVTLNGPGVYVFRSGGALNSAANSLVTLAGGACASDVYWAPVGLTTLGANAALSPTPTFVGSILDAAGITIGHFANLTGRALAFGGTVTTDANTITVPTCAAFVPGATPTLAKAFSPNPNGLGGISTLTITLTNTNPLAATLTVPLVDTLPAGVVLAASPNGSTTCGGVVTAAAGGSSVTLSAGSVIPAGGTCTVIANVTSATAGIYTDTIAANALTTSNGNNAVAAIATLTISAAIAPVPTLSPWAMIVLAGLLCLSGFFAIRRRRITD